MMIWFAVATVLSGLVSAGSVGAGPVLPEGQAGFARGVSIVRPLAPAQLPDADVLAGDESYVIPGPHHRPPLVIRRLEQQYHPPKPAPRAVIVPWYDDAAVLPASCQREYFTPDTGWAFYLGARCLEEVYYAARDLPQYCALTIRTEGRLRDVYDEYCLRQAGYTVSGW